MPFDATSKVYKLSKPNSGEHTYHSQSADANTTLGIDLKAVKLSEDGITLLITVDNGSSSKEEIDLAAQLDMDVVVCDHHQPSGDLPAAVAHINPWLRASDKIFKSLAGVGVTYKLVWALCRHFSKEKKLSEQFRDFMVECLGLAALGTIADVVPLLEENRILARFGLRELERSRRPGIRKLVDVAQQRSGGGALSTEDVGFGIGPRINAAGRLAQADAVLTLFGCKDPAQARRAGTFVRGTKAALTAVSRRIVTGV